MPLRWDKKRWILSKGPKATNQQDYGVVGRGSGLIPAGLELEEGGVQAALWLGHPSPPQLGPPQGSLHVHVLAVVVGDDDAEVWVPSGLEELFHVSDELLYPPGLVLHCPQRQAGRAIGEGQRLGGSLIPRAYTSPGPLLTLPHSCTSH